MADTTIVGTGTYATVWALNDTCYKVFHNTDIDCVMREVLASTVCDHPGVIKLSAVCTNASPAPEDTENTSSDGMSGDLSDDGSLSELSELSDDISSARPPDDIPMFIPPASIYLCMPRYVCDLSCYNLHYDPAEMIIGIVDAVAYIHSRGIIHRDIKPNNILITAEGRPVLCDFGISSYCHLGKYYGIVQSLRYRAPEISPVKTAVNIYDQKIDIWSIGCIMAEIVTKKPLVDTICKSAKINMYHTIGLGPEKYDTYPQAISAFLGDAGCGQFTDIIADCLQIDPTIRPNATDISERLGHRVDYPIKGGSIMDSLAARYPACVCSVIKDSLDEYLSPPEFIPIIIPLLADILAKGL
jgi:hypothetical protein